MTEQDFLAPIIDRPDADQPRLIYADWLDEQGECDRAEFVRVGCALAALPRENGGAPLDEEKWAALQRRERELLLGRGWDWAGEAIEQIGRIGNHWENTVAFRRGFVRAVICTAGDWLAGTGEYVCERCNAVGRHLVNAARKCEKCGTDFVRKARQCIGDAITAAQPIEEVTLTTWPDVTFHGHFVRGGYNWSYATVASKDVEVKVVLGHSVMAAALSARWPRVKTWNLPPPTGPRTTGGASTVQIGDGPPMTIRSWELRPLLRAASFGFRPVLPRG
jgi:uncharacterized protein (TIGR02996 family)